MELRQLKYFVKAAEKLNFSEAAKALFITQSTLSQQIRQLEQEMNTQLFERNSHAVYLTESGKELLPLALRTIHMANTCMERIHDLQHLLTGELNIGVTFTFSPIFTETLLYFMKLYPQVKLNVYYKPMAELMEMLERHEVDFVLAFKPTRSYDGIESHILFNNHLSAIVNESHPLAEKERVTLSEIAAYDIALPARGLQARNAFERILSQHPTNLRVMIELNEVHILLQLIKQSELFTVLSEATIYNKQGVKAIPIDVPDNDMVGCVHMLKDVYRKHSAQEFIKQLSESNAIKKYMQAWL